MSKKIFFLSLFFIFLSLISFAQKDTLPFLSLKSLGNRVIVSWKQNYKKPIATLNIQRSFDSLRNYKTIGEVLSPQSIENGYIDANPPYRKMYYRIFIAFEGGSYVYSNTYRASKDTSKFNFVDSTLGNFPNTSITNDLPWLKIKPKSNNLDLNIDSEKITYPSQRIYTLKDNNIVITLQNTALKKYSIKFYTENNKFLFEIKRVKEDNFIIEKVNFGKTGWYKFELFDGGELIESNKFQILKPIKGI